MLGDFPEASLTSVYVMFPDPWPKTRHANRRIFSPSMMDRLAFCLKPGGSLRFASDHPVAKSWLLAEVLRNQHSAGRPNQQRIGVYALLIGHRRATWKRVYEKDASLAGLILSATSWQLPLAFFMCYVYNS